MTTPAVQVQQIGKQYQLGLREKRNQTFREAMIDLAASPLRRLRHLSGRAHEDDTFWALKDVCFDVPEGEVLGIIGHNGAGKSTLLKILSRITEPTEGRATIHGRVASLLEVGTGFHNELTGRENVYLNGAILGMSRAEIDRKFDEIVDFAGVERFLDTPIKRYSSGMKVRLAFAVAAHLEPEILIIDEVLAVGDQEFQNKCLGKMQDVATSGRTVLFVSHNMAAVEALCSRCLLLQRGTIIKNGETSSVLQQYASGSQTGKTDTDLGAIQRRNEIANPILKRAIIQDLNGTHLMSVTVGSTFQIALEIETSERIPKSTISIQIINSSGTRSCTLQSAYQHAAPIYLNGRDRVVCQIKNFRLVPDLYFLNILVMRQDNTCIDRVDQALSLEVLPSDIYETGRVPSRKHGFYLPEVEWLIP